MHSSPTYVAYPFICLYTSTRRSNVCVGLEKPLPECRQAPQKRWQHALYGKTLSPVRGRCLMLSAPHGAQRAWVCLNKATFRPSQHTLAYELGQLSSPLPRTQNKQGDKTTSQPISISETDKMLSGSFRFQTKQLTSQLVAGHLPPSIGIPHNSSYQTTSKGVPQLHCLSFLFARTL